MLVSLIIIVGFLSHYQFCRTGVPGILFIILLGFLFGPVFGIVRVQEIEEYAPYLADLATIFILFEAGLAMNLRKIFSETPRAMLLTLLHLILCTVAVTAFLTLIGVPPLYGALFGIMVSGNSAAILIPILHTIRVREEAVTSITLESTLNNVFQVVSFLALIEVIATGDVDVFQVAQGIAARFCVGGVVGALFGLVWLKALSRIKREAYASMLTIAVLFVSYYVSEFLGGNGALSALLFGVMLGNERVIRQLIGPTVGDAETTAMDDVYLFIERERASWREYLIRFESEIAFLVRTFIFVYIGVSLNVTNPLWILYGTILTALLFGMRVAAATLATIRSPLQAERSLITVVMARGLNEAVLSVVFLTYNLAYTAMFQQIAFIIIILTNIITTIGVYRYTHNTHQLGTEETPNAVDLEHHDRQAYHRS